MLLQMAEFPSSLWLSNIPLYVYVGIHTHTHTHTFSLFINLLLDSWVGHISWQL